MHTSFVYWDIVKQACMEVFNKKKKVLEISLNPYLKQLDAFFIYMELWNEKTENNFKTKKKFVQATLIESC